MNRHTAEVLLVAGLLAATLSQAATPADHLFVGENILTMTPAYEAGGERPTALATRGEEIVWVGDAGDAGAWTGPATERHDLGSRALLPGLIDAHGHLTYLAPTRVNLALMEERWPDLEFRATREH